MRLGVGANGLFVRFRPARILVFMASKQDKEALKAAKAARKAESKAKRSQIWQAFKMQRKEDKLLIPWMLGVFLVITAAVFLLGMLFDIHWMALPVGIMFGVLGAVIVFGRRVQRNVFSKADGQPGAGAWALENLKRGWRVTPTVAATTQLDAVHRVLGRPGIVLVAEGAPHRVKTLLAQEKKRISRLVGDTPIYDLIIGNEEGQVPLAKLQSRLMKLPRNLGPKQVDVIEKRLSALASRGAALPKGPMPQGAKMRNVQRTIRRR
ncbi:protein of unknown function [Kibdelosporangium aridum]|uniref:DUF4191 domain-containing protein n=2 Tax=Kibdelosporangium aridum TaxID=2030 RepID=A0A1Y5YC64_KIBAR|nr:protein of unknown function [Kibdelosporangium aridum]